MEIKDIIELMKAVSDNGLTKFELEDGDTKLVMKREKKIVTVSGAGIPAVSVPVAAGAESFMAAQMVEHDEKKYGSEERESNQVITCPLVGTFYSSPSPEAECFVKVGDHVKKGQVVGIVEAMKLMNEIESEYDGVVEAVLVDNESVVEYGQPLFRIR
ncbi:MAG: acetyl-CoA carboxylase biotin carboxyl carrier protein [Lachnospiraceae bacterium]|nr:acetyl-CoA carboxylase biotin carboxyl carrier protein [Lachnospiraceae bacterium]